MADLAESIARSQDRITKLLQDGSSGFADINDALSGVASGKMSYGEALNGARAGRINNEMGLFKTLSGIQQNERAIQERQMDRQDAERRHSESQQLRRDLAGPKDGPLSDVAKLRADLKAGRITQQDFDAKMKGEGGGPFAGNGMDAQTLNILLKGNPNSPEYEAAYRHQATPKVSIDPATNQPTYITPDMSAFRKPARMAQAVPPTAGGPVPTAMPGRPNVDQPTGPTRKQKEDLEKALIGAASITNALEDFKSARAGAGVGQKVRSVAGMNTPLNTSYNVAALLAKGDELFQLGVLNGPDLEILQKALADPGTIKGAFTSDDDVEGSIDKIISVMQDKISARQKQMKMEPTSIRDYGRSLRTFQVNPPTGGDLSPEEAAELERLRKGQN